MKILRNCTAETLARKPYGRGIQDASGSHIWGMEEFQMRKKCSLKRSLPNRIADFPFFDGKMAL
jgi:hypothetical protein